MLNATDVCVYSKRSSRVKVDAEHHPMESTHPIARYTHSRLEILTPRSAFVSLYS